MWTIDRARNGDEIDEYPPNIELYGIDWNGPIGAEGENGVRVIEIPCPLNDVEFQELKLLLPDTTVAVSDYGVDMFKACRDFVTERC